MSRVNIVIDGVQWGLDISPEHTIDLIQALNGVAIEARKPRAESVLATKRAAARDAFENVLDEISFASRKSA